MTGLGMMLNALGVKIDPAELEQKFNEAKDAIPVFAARAELLLTSINDRLGAIEHRLSVIEESYAMRAALPPVAKVGGESHDANAA